MLRCSLAMCSTVGMRLVIAVRHAAMISWALSASCWRLSMRPIALAVKTPRGDAAWALEKAKVSSS
eukprot:1121375-Alexandrium_andersonii.AAC.1